MSNNNKKNNTTKVILNRELKTYFTSPAAYFITALFLVTIGIFFYSTFFLNKRAELRVFFSLLPYAFTVFIPALTMRSFAEEQKSGSIETLMTLPVRETNVVLGKFYASFVTSLSMLAFTLFYIVSLLFFGQPDFGPIIGGYAGAVILCAVYSSIGIFGSSITKNQIVALITSLGISALFTFIHLFLPLVPPALVKVLSFVAIVPHFNSIAHGIIDTRDIVYFISVIIIFILATITLQEKRRSQDIVEGRIKKWLKSTRSDRFLVLIILVLLNLVSIRGFLHFDLTSQKTYSLSKASKDTVKLLESPLSVKVFFSKNLPSPYNQVEQYVTDLLAEYKANASENFSYQIFDMSKEENQRIAESYGLGPVQIDTVEAAGFSSKLVWMGLAITFGDYIATVDSLKKTSDIEYKITTLISKIVAAQSTNSDKLFKIGYITGHGENELRTNQYAQSYSDSGSGNFKNILSDIYSISQINLSKSDIPENLKAIIINSPKEKIPQEELAKIDRFIANGGNAVFFVNPLEQVSVQDDELPSYVAGNSGIEDLLLSYGIELEHSYVMDENCYTQNQSGFGKQVLNFAPVVAKKQLSKTNPITKNLGSITFFANGPIDISKALENKNLTTTVLAKSSPQSWCESENIILYPGYITPPKDKSDMKSQNLAVLVEGKIKDENSSPAKIIVVSSGIVTTDVLLDREGSSPTALFVRNAIDYINGNPDFCTMRTKGTRLDFISVKSEKSVVIVQLLNEFGLAVSVLIIGFIVWRIRIARRYFIHQKYNSNDERLVKQNNSEEK